jgi:hypothetical protein
MGAIEYAYVRLEANDLSFRRILEGQAMTEQPSAQVELVQIEPEKKDKKKKKEKGESRGIDTMFRVTYQNHVALSRLADNKANMLISINGLIISVMIAIVTRTGALTSAILPVVVLVGGATISLAFAVIAARPRLGGGGVTLEEVRSGTGNLLFFGQFTSMPLDEFQESLKVLRRDPELMYAHLGRQLYHMGESLSGKYRRLQIAYAVFLGATALAVALFVAMYAAGEFSPPV